jgi:ADP-ribose pyrophosphatase YjhB (NUDIX family)
MRYSFCPKCGGRLEDTICTKCGFVFYQNAKATASAVIVDGKKTLLGKRKNNPRKGMWDTLGGFLEGSEHPIDGLRREIREELGVEIEVEDFLGFFMGKYIYQEIEYDTLNLAWICRIKSGEPKANDDISEIVWFDLDNLPEVFHSQAI